MAFFLTKGQLGNLYWSSESLATACWYTSLGGPGFECRTPIRKRRKYKLTPHYRECWRTDWERCIQLGKVKNKTFKRRGKGLLVWLISRAMLYSEIDLNAQVEWEAEVLSKRVWKCPSHLGGTAKSRHGGPYMRVVEEIMERGWKQLICKIFEPR